jgi:mannose-1-phosphate guanylyltransferase
VTAGAHAFLLGAGRGTRFLPVTERIPKPLFPFLNVPLAEAHLRRLAAAGVGQAAVNLHHLGEQIEQHLIDRRAELPKLRFFRERDLLGTAGGLKNAASFLSTGDFLVVNSDAAIEPDFGSLLARHRDSGRPATLLLVENREPDRYTPLQTEGDRVTGFGRRGGGGIDRPLLYTGVCVLDPRVLDIVPPGETSLVEHVWRPLLDAGEEIGWVFHEGPFADLGRPGDFLRASLEALARGGPFPKGAGTFDERARTLSLGPPAGGLDAERSVVGGAAVGTGARLFESVVWSGARVGEGTRLERCVVAGGVVPDGREFRDVLLWAEAGAPCEVFPLQPL